MVVKEILNETGDKMKRVSEALRREFAGLRAGRATPALLERIMVDYYGVQTPINQLANISVPEPRLLVIQPWDKTIMPNIEKAILKSDLGITPANDGTVIRLVVPQLTEERRQELVKNVRKSAENGRVAVRNIRREANENIKKLEKKGEISEDESRRTQDEVQKLTDEAIREVDRILAAKEKEILEV